MSMQKTLVKNIDKPYWKGYEPATNKLIKDHTTDRFFYPTGMLAEIIGRMVGNIESMRDDRLDSLDKKYYADALDNIADDLVAMRNFMFNHGMYMVEIQADKNS